MVVDKGGCPGGRRSRKLARPPGKSRGEAMAAPAAQMSGRRGHRSIRSARGAGVKKLNWRRSFAALPRAIWLLARKGEKI